MKFFSGEYYWLSWKDRLFSSMRELDAYLSFCATENISKDKGGSSQEGTKNIGDNSKAEKQNDLSPGDLVMESVRVSDFDFLSGIKTLGELRDAMEAVATPLKEGCNNLVFSDGVATSDVLLIGEAPGRDEDLQGRPFVGQSGQLLDRILASIGLSRTVSEGMSTVYITNVLPWRPPGNRTPTQDEIDKFLPYLMKHIEIISPKIIVLWGATALKAVFPNAAGILRERGIWREITVAGKSIPTIATFHPAFLLRQPARKREVWEDMKSLRAKLI